MIDQLRQNFHAHLVAYVKQEWPELAATKIVDETFRRVAQRD